MASCRWYVGIKFFPSSYTTKSRLLFDVFHFLVCHIQTPYTLSTRNSDMGGPKTLNRSLYLYTSILDNIYSKDKVSLSSMNLNYRLRNPTYIQTTPIQAYTSSFKRTLSFNAPQHYNPHTSPLEISTHITTITAIIISLIISIFLHIVDPIRNQHTTDQTTTNT